MSNIITHRGPVPGTGHLPDRPWLSATARDAHAKRLRMGGETTLHLT